MTVQVVPGKHSTDNESSGIQSRSAVPTGLLVSARTLRELQLLAVSEVAWIDLKEPKRGPLGRPSLELLRECQAFLTSTTTYDSTLAPRAKFSVAGGELADWDETGDFGFVEELAPETYLKLALSQCGPQPGWTEKAGRIASRLSNPSQLILVHYADFDSCHAPSWKETLAAALNLASSYLLIDTFGKEAGNLLVHYRISQLSEMIDEAASRGVRVALAGSLRIEDLQSLAPTPAEWLGVRGAVCENGLRTSALCPKKLNLAVAALKSFGTKTV